MQFGGQFAKAVYQLLRHGKLYEAAINRGMQRRFVCTDRALSKRPDGKRPLLPKRKALTPQAGSDSASDADSG
jgi:hypothetical protein